MGLSIQNVLETADSRTVLVALVSIGLSLAIGLFPTILRVLCWIASTLRLKWLVHTQSNNNSYNQNSSSDISVSGIFVHPVKSLRSISLQKSTLDPKGLTDDRRFMVVYELPLPVYREQWERGDTSHRFLTQRQCPSLATISASIQKRSNSQKVLVLEQKGDKAVSCKKLEIPLTKKNASKQTYLAGIWDDVVAVDDMGDEAAAFLQAIANADEELSASSSGDTPKKIVRLVKESSKSSQLSPPLGFDNRAYVPSFAKTWSGGHLGKPTLSDGFPILIASEASLELLNKKLIARGKETIPMSRFRPNIVLKGASLEPFEEDRWKVILIGDTVFAIVKACPRCKQSCTDQVTGAVSSEPLDTMGTFRRSSGDQPSNGSVFFAQNAIPIGRLSGKTINVGDAVQILERGDPVYID